MINYLQDPVEVECIDDSNKPNEIKQINWVKRKNIYHVISVAKVLITGELAFELAEISTECPEYPRYKARRFRWRAEDTHKLFKVQEEVDLTEIFQEEYIKI